MAKVIPSKQGGKPPITRHPLFPATVALWFGALFGIGSLAIRPSLIEGLVVSLGIDAIFPAAAPPLGATTRILLALALAAAGGWLGAWLARRIARPKPVVVERKRGAAKAGARLPAVERLSTAPTGRRGNLSLNDEGKPRDSYIDHAPVPGGANILDVSQFDLEGFEAEIPAMTDAHGPAAPQAAFEAPEQPLPETQAQPQAWLPDPDYREIPTGAQVFQPIEAVQPAAETADTQTVSELAPALDSLPADSSSFDPAPAPFAGPADCEPVRFDAPATLAEADNPQESAPFAAPQDPEAVPAPFAMEHEQLPPSEPEGVPVEAEATPLPRLGGTTDVSHEPLPPRVRAGSIFDQKPATALFAQPFQTHVSNVEWNDETLSVTDAPAVSEAAPAMSAPQAGFPPEPEIEPVQQVAEAIPEPAGTPASERIAAAPLGDLSQVELLERLARSMRRKQSQAPAPLAAEPVREAVAPPVPAPFMPEPSSPEQPVEARDARPAPPIPSIPDALRPIGFFEDDDGDHLPTFVPPRHFGQPQDGQADVPAQVQAHAMPEDRGETVAQDVQRSAVEADLPETGAADPLDEGYSSLLSMSRPGTGIQRFVRIEEPAEHSAEIEPVVIFPSKERHAAEGPFSRPNGQADGNSHLVDGEASAGSQSIAVSNRPDPEETDRALRSALANLQRMSGAA